MILALAFFLWTSFDVRGNPVAIAAAVKTLDILENGVMKNCRDGRLYDGPPGERQQEHAPIAEVRGLGLMIGVEIARDRESTEAWTELRDKFVLESFNQGVVIQGAGESAGRFSPPLIVDREQVDFAANTLDTAVESLLK